jgi:beta-phosphoglucomutase-like phosphatase (HAD superfamily)
MAATMWPRHLGRRYRCALSRIHPFAAEVIGHHADVIPGVAHTVELLRQRCIAIGSTTGYTRAVMRTARETRVAVGT